MKLPKLKPRYYLAMSATVLGLTTLLWTLLGAGLQVHNTDQIVNVYLFQDTPTLTGATLPGAHSFFLKWPLFSLSRLFGVSPRMLVVLTMICVAITIGGLAYILSRIERRPLVLGTIYLGLALTLLLVPPVPYPGGLLPVNMAMLTTRNVEYLVYVGALIALAKTTKLRSRNFLISIVLLSVLCASDKLFVVLSIGGALLALVVYAVLRNWPWVNVAVRWLVASIAGLGGALVLLGIATGTKLLHIASQTTNSPYGITHAPKDIVLGIFYAGTSIFTNFGANPAFDAAQLSQIPGRMVHNLASFSGPGLLVNIAICLLCIFAVVQLVRPTLRSAADTKRNQPSAAVMLSVMLVCASLAGMAAFVVTRHDYVVDARYLTITLFTGFIALATYARSQKKLPKQLSLAGPIILVAIVLGSIGVVMTYHRNSTALQTIEDRNHTIVEAMAGRHANLLVGDYWRVVPVQLAAQNQLQAFPLSGCTTPRIDLSSKAWQQDLANKPFSYLLTNDGGGANFPSCKLDQITAAYGRPNASVVIAGTLAHPQELLLFYDHGVQKSAPSTPGPATVIPTSLDELPYTSCPALSVMNIVAHQDDDLLFMNPDIQHSISDGHCVRTVYVTAGDAGRDQAYVLGRIKGVEAAYATMSGDKSVWIERIVRLSDRAYATVANPKGNRKLSLIFMNLPDGNLKGEGFSRTGNQSLLKLSDNKIQQLQSVDKQSRYSSDELVGALSSLMHVFQPGEIRTQAAGTTGGPFPDHSDHLTVGHYAQKAIDRYSQQQFEGQVAIPVRRYIGYPIRNLPPDVFGADLQAKTAAFMQYARYDGATCRTLVDCQHTPTYGAYLSRQYVQ